MNHRFGTKLTREQTRTHNTRLVLRTIYDLRKISRADIARETGLTRATVSDVVAELIDEGLVEEIGTGPSAGGKPPILLGAAEDGRHLIGVDLASDEFRGAVVNLRGEIRHQVTLPLHDRDGEEALALASELIDQLVAVAEQPLLGIGIGSPGLMDATNGVVRRSVNLNWHDLPLRELLEKRHNLSVYVANDSQVAALAEYTFGGGPGVDNLVVIKVGHGIGAGIVLQGRIFHGETFGAGEIGHVAVVENGERCRCGNLGCLETVASTRAILSRARELAENDPGSQLNRYADSPEGITMVTLCQALAGGDAGVQGLVADVGRYLGMIAANLVSVLSARRIVIAGTVACLGSPLLEVVRQEMMKRALSIIAEEAEIGLSSIGSDIVILGASALVLNRELGLFASPMIDI
jgi:N-acetylglucosamine repressor